MADLRYRGREIGEEDILSIRALIDGIRVKAAANYRRAYVKPAVRQSNGALRDMVCAACC